MFKYLNKLLDLPRIYFFIHNSLKRQKNFLERTVVRDIEQINKVNDGSLNEGDFKKITDYYSYAVPGILGEGYCMLRGRTLNERERYALTYYGGLTGLFDDFFDEKQTQETHIQELLSNPREEIASNAHELLFVRFYLKALEHTIDISELKKRVKEVYQIQLWSNSQKQHDISQKEIEEITIEKGGISLLFYRKILDGALTNSEEKMIHHLGGLMQLENDIFDVYKDYQGGIKTLVTTTDKIAPIRTYYKSSMQETFNLIQKTDFPQRNKKKFQHFISLILSRGLVCLDCLEKNEKTTSNTFRLDEYTRKQLICDMEHPGNMWKTVQYYLNI